MSDTQYAGFWIRFLASLIDSILLSMLLAPSLPLLIGEASVDPMSSLNFSISLLISLAATVLFWRYRSATPGKMVLGLHIVDAKTGGKPTGSQLFIRYLGYYVSLIPLGIGFIVIGLDARKQGWHDKMSGTCVVKNKAAKENSANVDN
jgi:uncharacterized RDD family membrane protein YckC